MAALGDHEDVELGTLPVRAQDIAQIDAAAYSRGATREAVIRQLLRDAIRILREVTR